MKKTLTVNIAGAAFSIDEESYQMLEGYLNDIERRLIANGGDSETITDIETRIMEIIQERLSGYQSVVDVKLIKYVISVIGSPSIFGDVPNQSWSYQNNQAKKRPRRLLRNPFNTVIAGVCSGLAAYLKVDVVLVRIISILFIFSGFGIICYIVCWIIIPEARSLDELYSSSDTNNNN